MNVLELFQTFQTQEQAVEYLESVRWRGKPTCPYCQNEKVGRHASGDRESQRWQCRDCTRAFSVTVGTLFHGTHMPLRQWFLVLALMLNAKNTASAYQISRDTGIRRATVWSMMQRIRTAMADDPANEMLLRSIVEDNEADVGHRPCKSAKHDDNDDFKTPGKQKRVSPNAPSIGAGTRSGRFVARVLSLGTLPVNSMSKFIKRLADPAGAAFFKKTEAKHKLNSFAIMFAGA